VRLRDVAQAADVHPALIGRYIGTKDDLVKQVFERVSNDVAASVADHPLAGQGFAPGSLVWTWARIASALVISGRSLTGMTGFNPVTVMASTLQDAYGLDPRAAHLRASQIVAAALGWGLFEDYLIEAGGLGDVPLETVRDELTRSMRRLGATPWPPPSDPTPCQT
jgi:AcrR family transcriptional regulator